VGLWDPESVEKDARHAIVVMLPRVHENFCVAHAQLAAYCRCLNELGSCPDDGDNLHRFALGWRRGHWVFAEADGSELALAIGRPSYLSAVARERSNER